MDKSLKQNDISPAHDQTEEILAAPTPSPDRTRVKRITDRLWRWREQVLRTSFWQYLGRQFLNDEGLQQAGVLSYTSLLALVPLMAVVLGVVSAFPVFENWSDHIQDFVFQNFVPAAGATVQQYVQQFVGNARVLTGPGALFLVITALLLMANIERAFNRIWRVEQARPIGSRILVYWAVLTLGPMLLGGSLALTSLISSWQTAESVAWLSGIVGWLLKRAPFFIACLGFTLMYFSIPNRRVVFSQALLSGLIAALLFEAAKMGFVWYVKTFPTYEKLYGALAVIPVFLVWIYVTWLVTLFGASLNAALSRARARAQGIGWGERRDFVLAYRVLHLLWQAQCRAKCEDESSLIARLPAEVGHRLNGVLAQLLTAEWVRRTEEGQLILAIDVEHYSLGDLYGTGPYVLPLDLAEECQSDVEKPLAVAMADIKQQSEQHLSASLKTYFQASA